jgi:RNA polymerase sigma-70 factor (ECF subfamily)
LTTRRLGAVTAVSAEDDKVIAPASFKRMRRPAVSDINVWSRLGSHAATVARALERRYDAKVDHMPAVDIIQEAPSISVACACPQRCKVDCATAKPSRVITDAALIRRIADADQAALRTFMKHHRAGLLRFIQRFITDQKLGEDIASDAFLAVWQRARYFESRSSVATWLLAIARYKALSARDLGHLVTVALDDETAATLVDPGRGPDIILEQKDTARFLRQCLVRLPPEQLLLIELVYFRDKSVKEAAIIAGIPENTVKSRMFLARKKLAAQLMTVDIDGTSSSPGAEAA